MFNKSIEYSIYFNINAWNAWIRWLFLFFINKRIFVIFRKYHFLIFTSRIEVFYWETCNFLHGSKMLFERHLKRFSVNKVSAKSVILFNKISILLRWKCTEGKELTVIIYVKKVLHIFMCDNLRRKSSYFNCKNMLERILWFI